MCLIVFSWQPDAATPLVVLANRDEFFERPAEPLHWWLDHPDILAGRDLRGGGTWMGVNRVGRFAALTNFRDGRAPMAPKDSPSRGLLVSAMLDATSFDDDLARVEKHAHEYAGFNLLAGDLPARKLYWLGNRVTHAGDGRTAEQTGGRTSLPVAHAIAPGFHGLSNALLDTPWPKLVSRRNALRDALENGADDIALMEVMRDAVEAADESLPETGVTHDWEKKLSAAFIASPAYGTRCTTLLRYHRDGVIEVTESTVSPSQPASELRNLRHYRFDVNSV
ncbi:NRDE family protein [Pandoraea commovens]|uniref:NRDE family protein n=1 Tax=Pandoraea commovens TaxID=2508289 RepID=A0A5E4S7M0_9BURK|nr:NRDE family protein [Pandoraea commovens]UVA77487.1 NRDE family protein [Pandoraea commovens]VVD71201.1 NRDE family protein [Pandoraea commovens]